VATDAAQLGQLDAIRARAHANGATEVISISAEEAREREPEVSCVGALWSPMTGIIDSHGLMLALLGEIEARGGALALKSPIVGGSVGADGIRLEVGGAEPTTLLARRFVNAAGLDAQRVARLLAGFPAAKVPRQHLAKGCYFTLAGRQPFRHLVYPVPEPGGLGVHVTLDLAGQARFGPDVEWIDTASYHVDPERAAKFYGAVRRYWPGLADGAIQPGYAGIRPKLSGPGEPDADFVVQGPAEHGVPGLVNFFGIESPGLTASLALAQMAAQALESRPLTVPA
jgi:L-2-hydroxyglutarate oxidase LhgO